MGLTKKEDSAAAHPMYYKENNTPLRETKFFLKPVQPTTAKGKKSGEVTIKSFTGKVLCFGILYKIKRKYLI